MTAGTLAATFRLGVTVTAVLDGVTRTGTATVIVLHGPVDSVLISPSTATLSVGDTQQFSVQVEDAFDNPITDAEVTWEVAAGAGSVTVDGLMTAGTRAGAYDPGVTVTAALGGVSRTADAVLIIEPGPLDHVEMELAEVTLAAGGQHDFSAKAKDEFDNTISGLTFTWSVSLQTGGGTIDANNGLFTAGTTSGTFGSTVKVEVTQGAVTRTATASVTISASSLGSVAIDQAAATLEVTQQLQFSATALDTFGNAILGLIFTFSSDGLAGQVTSGGLFTSGTTVGTFDGTVTVEATLGAVTRTGSATVTVTHGPVNSVVVSPAVTLNIGDSHQFSAQVFDAFDNPITADQITWTADAGTISTDGLMTAGTIAGTFDAGVTATGTLGGVSKTGSAIVVVLPGPIDRVLISPTTVTLSIGDSQQFNAQVVDASGNSITGAQITWTAVGGAGTISTGGLFTGGACQAPLTRE